MMKIAFISDIHGNARALDQVLVDIKQKNIDRIYVLGDLCYRGPEPKRSLDLVRALNTEVIKGNADEWVVRGVREGEVPEKALAMMNRERDWTVFHLDPSDVDYLKQLPSELHLSFQGVAIHAFHATPHSLFDIVAPNADDPTIQSSLMSAVDSQIYVYAHIHKPYIRYMKGKVIINTGSVGLPFDGLAMASYATVEITDAGIRTAIERVHTDVESVVLQYDEVQYPNAAMMINVLRNASV
jgi:putative phosphoesterase